MCLTPAVHSFQVRLWGCDVLYTPMILADAFRRSAHARDSEFTTNGWDRPLIVQFASPSAEAFAEACQERGEGEREGRAGQGRAAVVSRNWLPGPCYYYLIIFSRNAKLEKLPYAPRMEGFV